jgi:hypothetical protein
MSEARWGLPNHYALRVIREEQRHLAVFKELISRNPEYRRHFAYAMLGAAVGLVDSVGGDVEEFVAGLRKQFKRPIPIEPPEESNS